MTELIINGTRAVLPRELNFTIFDESAYLTNNGEFSLDITLSLTNPVNRKIFKHRERLNVKNLIEEASADLIVNNKVSRGKITDIRNTDTTVSFQFIAGNSFVNNEILNKKIWEFNWGIESSINFTKAKFSVEHPGYGEVVDGGSVIGFNNYVCTPIKFNNLIANNYILSIPSAGGPLPYLESVENIVMQPYLLYYIQKLPGLFGYALKENVLLDDELARKMFLANRVNSLKYSDALPDIFMFEFIDAIEELFQVKFIFDKNKECRIINNSSYIDNMEILENLDVIDEFELERDNQDQYDGIAYDLSSDGFNQYNKLNLEILKACTSEVWPNRNSLKTNITTPFKNKFILHITADNSRHFVYCNKLPVNLNCIRVDDNEYVYYVNRFRSSDFWEGNYKPLHATLLPFSSAELTMTVFNVPQSIYYYTYQLPVISSTLFEPTQQLIGDAMQNNVEQISRANKLEVALFSGMLRLFHVPTDVVNDYYGSQVYYPVSHTDNIPEVWMHPYYQVYLNPTDNAESYNTYQETEFKNTVVHTLRIVGGDGIENRYFKDVPIIDKEKIYVFKILGYISSNTMMQHNNSIYIPFSIEKNVDVNGESEIKTAKFYKLK